MTNYRSLRLKKGIVLACLDQEATMSQASNDNRRCASYLARAASQCVSCKPMHALQAGWGWLRAYRSLRALVQGRDVLLASSLLLAPEPLVDACCCNDACNAMVNTRDYNDALANSAPTSSPEKETRSQSPKYPPR